MRRHRARRAGFTLLESMIVLLVATIIAVIASEWLLNAGAATNELNVEHNLIAADRGLAVLEDDLKNTSNVTAANVATPDSFTLTFQRITGYDITNDKPTFGPPIKYSFVLIATSNQTKALDKAAGIAPGTGQYYQLQRSQNGGKAVVLLDTLTTPGFGYVNGCVSVAFNVARSVAHGQTGKNDYRTRALSRLYKLAPG